MFKNGETLINIGKELKLGRGRFAEWLRNRGHQTKEDFVAKYEKGKELYLSGISITKIVKELNLSMKWFSIWLKDNDVEIRENRTYSLNENYFEVINTEEKAYWLGFLYADGCVCRSGKIKHLEMTLKEEDSRHIKKFLNAIESNAPIINKTIILNNKQYEACKVSIGSAKMCRDLIKIGCTPRKSLTLTFPDESILRKDLISHFIRGYVDGDGWIGISNNKKRQKARISILGTYNFLLGIQEVMGWNKVSIRSNQRNKAYVIEYGSIATMDYLNQLYENANIYLDRKYIKYKEIYAVLT